MRRAPSPPRVAPSPLRQGLSSNKAPPSRPSSLSPHRLSSTTYDEGYTTPHMSRPSRAPVSRPSPRNTSPPRSPTRAVAPVAAYYPPPSAAAPLQQPHASPVSGAWEPPRAATSAPPTFVGSQRTVVVTGTSSPPPAALTPLSSSPRIQNSTMMYSPPPQQQQPASSSVTMYHPPSHAPPPASALSVSSSYHPQQPPQQQQLYHHVDPAAVPTPTGLPLPLFSSQQRAGLATSRAGLARNPNASDDEGEDDTALLLDETDVETARRTVAILEALFEIRGSNFISYEKCRHLEETTTTTGSATAGGGGTTAGTKTSIRIAAHMKNALRKGVRRTVRPLVESFLQAHGLTESAVQRRSSRNTVHGWQVANGGGGQALVDTRFQEMIRIEPQIRPGFASFLGFRPATSQGDVLGSLMTADWPLRLFVSVRVLEAPREWGTTVALPYKDLCRRLAESLQQMPASAFDGALRLYETCCVDPHAANRRCEVMSLPVDAPETLVSGYFPLRAGKRGVVLRYDDANNYVPGVVSNHAAPRSSSTTRRHGGEAGLSDAAPSFAGGGGSGWSTPNNSRSVTPEPADRHARQHHRSPSASQQVPSKTLKRSGGSSKGHRRLDSPSESEGPTLMEKGRSSRHGVVQSPQRSHHHPSSNVITVGRRGGEASLTSQPDHSKGKSKPHHAAENPNESDPNPSSRTAVVTGGKHTYYVNVRGLDGPPSWL